MRDCFLKRLAEKFLRHASQPRPTKGVATRPETHVPCDFDRNVASLLERFFTGAESASFFGSFFFDRLRADRGYAPCHFDDEPIPGESVMTDILGRFNYF